MAYADDPTYNPNKPFPEKDWSYSFNWTDNGSPRTTSLTFNTTTIRKAIKKLKDDNDSINDIDLLDAAAKLSGQDMQLWGPNFYSSNTWNSGLSNLRTALFRYTFSENGVFLTDVKADYYSDEPDIMNYVQINTHSYSFNRIGFNQDSFKQILTDYYKDYEDRAAAKVEQDIATSVSGYAGGDKPLNVAGGTGVDGGGVDLSGYGTGAGTAGEFKGWQNIPYNKDTGLYQGEKASYYTYMRGKKFAGMQAILGEEISALGLKDKQGNLVKPEELATFATYTTAEGVEKPLVDYETSLIDRIQKGGEDPGVDARSLLAIRAKQGVAGAASAAQSSLSQTIQDATNSKLADRQAAGSAMAARVTAIEDKIDARSKLQKLKTDLLAHDMKREDDLYKLKAKTSVGMAGLAETAGAFAKEMFQLQKK